MTKYGFSQRYLYSGDDNSIRDKYKLPKYKCPKCKKYHVGFPPFIVPYKRYSSETFEDIVIHNSNTVAIEQNTRDRIRQWYYEKVIPKATSALARAAPLYPGVDASSLLKEFQAKHKPFIGRIVVLIFQSERYRPT